MLRLTSTLYSALFPEPVNSRDTQMSVAIAMTDMRHVVTEYFDREAEVFVDVELQVKHQPVSVNVLSVLCAQLYNAIVSLISYIIQLLQALASYAAWVNILTDSTSSFRQFRAAYVLIDAIFFATGSTQYDAFDTIFWTMFSALMADIALKVFYVAHDRSQKKYLQASTAVCLTEVLETTAAIITFGLLILDPTGVGTISLDSQWQVVAVALFFGTSQFITGIEDQGFGKASGHSCLEAFGEPTDEPVSLGTRFWFIVLRLLHLSHVLTLEYGVSDFLNTVFQQDPYFEDYPLHSVYIALPFTILFAFTTRLLIYCLWADNLPSYAKFVTQLDHYLYVTNNILLAFTAVVYTITLARENVEGQEGSSYIYDNLMQALCTVYIPSALITLPIFRSASEQYEKDFANEIHLRSERQGCTEKRMEKDVQNYSLSSSSAVKEWYKQEYQLDGVLSFWSKFTGPLKMRPSEVYAHLKPDNLKK